MTKKPDTHFNLISYLKNANRSEKITIWLFALVLFELALAYSPFLRTGLLADLSAALSLPIPALSLAETTEARTYITLTILLSPLVIWLMYLAEWEGKSFGDLMYLPGPGNNSGIRQLISWAALLLFLGGTGYFCFGNGVSELWDSAFLYNPHDPFKLWRGWAIRRLAAFCFCCSLLVLALRTYFAWIERNAP